MNNSYRAGTGTLAYIGRAACMLLSCFASSIFFSSSALATTNAAEIVLLTGKGEQRDAAAANWSPAAVKQKLAGGSYVRTLANSQMALLMVDRTQIRLNQNSQLQIKSAAESSEWTGNAVRLNSGRAWSQARPQVAQGGTAKSAKLTMETPSATMSIRGTDWEVEVGPDGSTQLVVLSGVVSMGNEYGTIEVGNGEAAMAEKGKAPVKLILLNPASRVQWVSSWKPQPLRWADKENPNYASAIKTIEDGDYSSALQSLRPMAGQDAVAAVLAADILIFQGENEAAVALLQPHATGSRASPLAAALLARAWARTDQFSQAEGLLDEAIRTNPAHIELLLARGELAILQGNAQQARQAYNEALKAKPDHAEAWYGLGLVESERENVRSARKLLNSALVHNPQLSKASAELAAVETFSGNLDTAEKLLDELLAREPENYIALTARGISRLKAGRTTEALEDFLRTGVIEPRYARGWLYSGVAFYQLGEHYRAQQAFKKAAELDTHDPVPYLLQSMIDTDALDYGASIKAASEAKDRMPYLKSLNQVANTQKGNANLGSSLASFGMEEWAEYYAEESYSPYWAGSHLFRADRYTGDFNKNSELYQGFLLDPIVFGASNRNSSLVSSPGHYGRIDLEVSHSDWLESTMTGTLNGMTVKPVPVAYFLTGDVGTADSRLDNSNAHGGDYTVGLGMKPRHDIGLFGFATDGTINGSLDMLPITNGKITLLQRRGDVGITYKLAPDNQFWLKAGDGSQQNAVSGDFISQEIADMLNVALPIATYTANGTLDRYKTEITQDDVQFRHTFTSGNTQYTWGVETSHQTKTGQMAATFTPVRLNYDELYATKAKDTYLSGRYQASDKWAAQLDAFFQRTSIKRNDLQSLDILLITPPINVPVINEVVERKYSEVNPRIGLKWNFAEAQNLRLIGQKWRRSASTGTLSQVDTLGIPVNDSLTIAGGLYKRARLQYEIEKDRKTFLHAYLDREWIDNGPGGQSSAVPDFGLDQLDRLRNRTDFFAAKPDLEDKPAFVKGQVSTMGVAANAVLSSRQTVSASYRLQVSHQTNIDPSLGIPDNPRIPYLPRHYLKLGSQWSLPGHWLLGANAVYRAKRYRDAENLDQIKGGWFFGLMTYWETADKKSSIHVTLENLLTNRKIADSQPYPELTARYSYRF